MKKIFSIFAAVLFAGSMMADSFTISFKDAGAGQGDSNTSLSSTTVADYVAAGADYVSAVAVSGKVYNGQDGYGLKFGNSSNPGSITLTLAASVTPTSIVMNASPWSATEGSGLLQDSIFATKSTGAKGTFADFTYVYDGATAVTTIVVGTSAKRGYVKSITINCEGGEVVPPVEDDCNWEEIAFLGNGSGNAAYTDRFKVCAGDPAPSSIVNIQSSFGTEPGIYVTFPSAEFGDISLEEDQYAIQGAGMLLYVSAFLYDAETEVTVVCQNVEYTITVKNVNPETAPVEPTTCFDIYQMAKNDVVDLLNDVTVTYANGKNVWVVDGSASMLLYFSANTNYAPGDVLSGVAGVVDIYNGVYELKPSAEQAAAIVATPGEAPAAIQTVVVETADMNKYIVMPGIQFEEDAAFTEGAQSNITMNGVTVRNQFKNGYAFEAGKKYNVYGVVTIYQNNPQVYFITAEELDTTGFDNAASELNAVKVIENGQLFIIKNGVRYDAQGAVVR